MFVARIYLSSRIDCDCEFGVTFLIRSILILILFPALLLLAIVSPLQHYRQTIDSKYTVHGFTCCTRCCGRCVDRFVSFVVIVVIFDLDYKYVNLDCK
jgi:hypothetical protein